MRVYQFRHVGTATADNDITDCLLRDRLLVPTEGLEPPHLAAHGPEPCASTNSATWALQLLTTILQTAYYEIDFWCPRRDSNPHTLRHMDLNHARLPIPPRGHCKNISATIAGFVIFRQINYS